MKKRKFLGQSYFSEAFGGVIGVCKGTIGYVTKIKYPPDDKLYSFGKMLYTHKERAQERLDEYAAKNNLRPVEEKS